jgi:hypothetical protein
MALLLIAILVWPSLLTLEALSRFKDKSEGLRCSLPNLAWLFAAALPSGDDTLSPVVVGALGLLVVGASLASRPDVRRWARIGSYALVLVALTLAVAGWSLGYLVTAVFVIGDWLGRITPSVISTVAAVTGLCIVALVAVAWFLFSNAHSGTVLVISGLVVTAAILLPSTISWPKALAPVLFSLACLGYLTTVGWGLRNDRALERISSSWINAASEYRQAIGLGTG